jgi:hypothetical protein
MSTNIKKTFERSSFGTDKAVAARRTIPTVDASRVVAHAAELAKTPKKSS